MNTDRQKILEMLQEGKITAAEATELLDALERAPDKPAGGGVKNSKKLRVKVDGNVENDNKIKVDVAVPLALGHMLDGILGSCIPKVAHDELRKQGIDISGLKIGELLESMDSDEDIVNVDIDNDDVKMKVRVYVD